MPMNPTPPETAASHAELADAVAVLEAEVLSVPGRAALAVLRHALLGGSAAPLARLTARQRQVAGLLAQGVSNRGIAVVLGIREGTAKLHVAAVLNRLGVSSREQVAVLVGGAGIDNAH
jgi:two-component system nitrate/nitrite response regulator NarL